MIFKISDIDQLAKLAKLEFSSGEKEKIRQQLSEILTYIDKLNELNTADVPPASHVLGLANAMREDSVIQGLTQDEALQNAPCRKMGFFSVPKVISHEK